MTFLTQIRRTLEALRLNNQSRSTVDVTVLAFLIAAGFVTMISYGVVAQDVILTTNGFDQVVFVLKNSGNMRFDAGLFKSVPCAIKNATGNTLYTIDAGNSTLPTNFIDCGVFGE